MSECCYRKLHLRTPGYISKVKVQPAPPVLNDIYTTGKKWDVPSPVGDITRLLETDIPLQYPHFQILWAFLISAPCIQTDPYNVNFYRVLTTKCFQGCFHGNMNISHNRNYQWSRIQHNTMRKLMIKSHDLKCKSSESHGRV